MIGKYLSILLLALASFGNMAWAECTTEEWAIVIGSAEAVPEANYYGDCGLMVSSDGQSAYMEGAAFVEDQTPGSVSPPVTEYAARFYIDASNITKVGDPAELVIFQGWRTDGTEAFHVKFAICDGAPVVSGYVHNASTGNITLPAGWQEITVWWKQDGTLRLRVAGVGEDSVQGDPTSLSLNSVRLGIATGTLRLFTGHLYFDEFASTRGQDPGPKVNVCSGQLVAMKDFIFDENAPKTCVAGEMQLENVQVKAVGAFSWDVGSLSVTGPLVVERGAQLRVF